MKTLNDCFNEKNNSLNLIRLLAAMAVIYGHANAVTGRGPNDLFLQIVGHKFIGGVAVDVFFVISGFLITASAMSNRGLIYYAVSRVLRIYPALVICVFLSVSLLGPILTTSDYYWSSHQTWKYFWVNATAYNTQYFLPGVFSSSYDKAVNGSLWSLMIEVRLYLIVMFLAAVRVLNYRALFNLLFFTSITVGYFSPESWSFIFSHKTHLYVAMMFMIGSFCWINRDAIIINAPLMLVFLLFAASQHNSPSFGIAYTLLLPYMVLYLGFSSWGAWFNRFGDYSYGVYLYGWISQQVILLFFPHMSNVMNALFGIAGALICAVISWHIVESPAQQLKMRFNLVSLNKRR